MVTKKYLSCLYIIRHNGSTGTFISNDNSGALLHGLPETGIKKLEHNVLNGSERGKWRKAYLYDSRSCKGAAPVHAYHHSRGTQRITKQEAEELAMYDQNITAKYNAYIIPTAAKQKEGKKPYTNPIAEIEDARDFLKPDVWQIRVFDIRTNELVQAFTQ